MCGALSGNSGVVSLLLQHNSPVGAVGPLGRTALWYAADRDAHDAVLALLQYNADPNVAGV